MTMTSLTEGMLPRQVLAVWADCCDRTGIRWYLHGDALLCAHGYGRFPDSLTCAQVAVRLSDLPAVTGELLSLLPESWVPDTAAFAQRKAPILFKLDGKPILEVHPLIPVASSEEAEALAAEVQQFRDKTRDQILHLQICNVLTLKLFRKGFRSAIASRKQQAFFHLLGLQERLPAGAPCCCDLLTAKSGAVIPAALLEETETLTCSDGTYPVISGWKAYLELAYGDFEAGLTDEIGCGLTVAEKAELRTHQDHCREALAFVQQLSEEFGLRYYLLAGSVLGAVRHQGFIPWDDDVDIGIRIEELAHFEEVVKRELPKRLRSGFMLVQCGPNNGYQRMFSKICYEGRCCIDLWPLVPTYASGTKARIVWYFGKIITKVHYKKLGQAPNRFVAIVNFLSLFLTDKMTLKLARWNERKYSKNDPPAYVNLYSIYRRDKETIRRQWLDTPATADFAGLTVPVVGCTEEYLTHLYGDYMAFPAPWKRASRHVDRFEKTE